MNAHDREEQSERDARRDRILQAAALMELFRKAHGREAFTADELRDWVASNRPGEPIDPTVVLTSEQIAAALSDCLREP